MIQQINEQALVDYIKGFEGVDTVEKEGDTYFFYQADSQSPDHRFPFITLITGEHHEKASDLDRPGVFRLNIGVSKETFLRLFGELPPQPGPDGIIPSGYDYTALNQLMPHPVYGRMLWVCVLNPSVELFEAQVKLLLVEAYERQVRKANG